jgi:hypothetical protein
MPAFFFINFAAEHVSRGYYPNNYAGTAGRLGKKSYSCMQFTISHSCNQLTLWQFLALFVSIGMA